MDLNKLSRGDKIYAGGALAYLIASVLPWFSKGRFSGNGWDVGFIWCRLWALLFIAAVVLLALPAFGQAKVKLPSIGYLALAALATLFALLKLIVGEKVVGVRLDRSIGLFLAVVAAGVTVYGGLGKFLESGGSLDELTDVDKIKRRFGERS